MRIKNLVFGGTESWVVEWRGQAGIGQSLEAAVERCITSVRDAESGF